MSGPIVRKYGFTNHEKIFGSRPLEHGVDDDQSAEPEAEKSSTAKPKKSSTPKAKSSAPKKKA